MKTIRFSQLVDKTGEPDVHLPLIEPSKDKVFQRAIKAGRVLTIALNLTGHRSDYGEVGFHPGPSRQYLIFPKAIGRFKGRKVVGIKYDLLEAPPEPKKKPAPQPESKPKRRPAHRPAPQPRRRGRAKSGTQREDRGFSQGARGG